LRDEILVAIGLKALRFLTFVAVLGVVAFDKVLEVLVGERIILKG